MRDQRYRSNTPSGKAKGPNTPPQAPTSNSFFDKLWQEGLFGTPGNPTPGSPTPGSPTPGSPTPGSPKITEVTPGSPTPVSTTPDSPPSSSTHTPGGTAPVYSAFPNGLEDKLNDIEKMLDVVEKDATRRAFESDVMENVKSEISAHISRFKKVHTKIATVQARLQEINNMNIATAKRLNATLTSASKPAPSGPTPFKMTTTPKL